MPAEILNQLGSIIPKTETSAGNKSTNSSTKSDPLDPLKSELRAMKFILNLPIIDVDILHEDEKFCGLCNRKYDDEFRVWGRKESPCCLPCGHIAGHQCLREYLSPYERGFTECPFCKVDFPQMFTNPVSPAQPTSDLAWVDVDDDHEVLEEKLSRQVSQLSRDSGVSSHDIKRFLSIDEVLERSRDHTEGLIMGTQVQDFAIQANDQVKCGGDEFPKNRRNAASPALARAAVKVVDLVAKKF